MSGEPDPVDAPVLLIDPALQQAAAQCSAMAGQAGATGNAPELGVLRTLLAGRTVPAVCAGF